ncbi:MAG: hypothetical protein ACTSRS_02360 [Candidatus Helarchaeota archaeon]
MAREIDDKIKRVESLLTSKSYQNAIPLLLDVIDFYDENQNFELRNQFLLKINECYMNLASISKKQQNYFDAAETFCSAAFLQKEHEQFELAKQLFRKAVECFECAGKQAVHNENFLEASRLFSAAGRYSKIELQDKNIARKYYQKAIEFLQKESSIHMMNDDPTSLCQTQLELGKIYEHIEDYEAAITQYQKVVECAQKHGLETDMIADCFQHMAVCYELLGNNAEMIDCLNNAVNFRLQEAEMLSECELPLEAVQNFIAAANCVLRLNNSDELLKNIIQNEADCFLTVAKSNIQQGRLLQAAFYERNAAYCYNQLGQSDLSIDLLLAAAEKLLSINDFQGAANNYQDASLYQQSIGDPLKAASYALQAAKLAKKAGDIELTIENFLRAAQIYQNMGIPEKARYCYSQLANCYAQLAESSLKTGKIHIAAYLFYKAGSFYSKIELYEKTIPCYERAIKYYEKASQVALGDGEDLLASYSICCATLVCLIMKQPDRAEIILNDIRDHSSNTYFQLSNSLIDAFKNKSSSFYKEIQQKFSKVIQNSPEIKNMFDLTKNYL